ncbi:DUF1318 domain-containing protein [Deltaproteobacteria bacterium]|nr:DUF1318 domain-containing protein [Deltaproteobacteria bacterium]
MKPHYLLVFVLLFLAGCTLAEVNVNVVSERTALENQVLGSYNSLDQDVLLVASVRGVDPLGRIQIPPERSQEHKDAVEGMQIMAFHADDVEVFKQLGWAGENNKGLLTPFVMDKGDIPEDLKETASQYGEEEFNTILNEVNSARDLVIRRVVEINDNFTMNDLPQIRTVFAKINRENALAGERIQNEDGSWTVK